MINFIIKSRYRKLIDTSKLERAVNAVFDHIKPNPQLGISVKITDGVEIRRLNKQYRGYDESTDVLSFNNEFIDLETGEQYLGDIVISYPTAKFQAEVDNHTVNDELELLVIHGCLHLFGYDHASEVDQKSMEELQKKLLFGLNNPIINIGDSAHGT